jgi:hypothetical protein
MDKSYYLINQLSKEVQCPVLAWPSAPCVLVCRQKPKIRLVRTLRSSDREIACLLEAIEGNY